MLVYSSFTSARAGDQPPRVIREPYSITLTNGNNSLIYIGFSGVNFAAVNVAYEQEVLDLVNSERANEAPPFFKRVTALDYAARYQSVDLGQDDYFKHDFFDRVNGNLTMVCGAFTGMSNFYPFASGENILSIAKK